MTRTIKFRAFDKDERVMHHNVQDWYDTLTEKPDDPPQTERSFGDVPKKDERYIVMQFTGLLDKQGKEIYEGDILRLSSLIGEIKWDDMACGFIWFGKDAFHRMNYAPDNKEMEVIGNIWENGYLLHDIKQTKTN